MWDLTRAATGGKPPIEMARLAADSYVECGTAFPGDTAEDRLARALEIVLPLRGEQRVNRVLQAMFDPLDRSEHTGGRAAWLFDELYDR